MQCPVLATDSQGLYPLSISERFEVEGQGYCCSLGQGAEPGRFMFHCDELGGQALAMTLVEPLAQMLIDTPQSITVDMAGLSRRYSIVFQQQRMMIYSDRGGALNLHRVSRFQRVELSQHNSDYRAGMVCNVIDVLVAPGETVAKGQPLLVTEAMKMENTLHSREDGTITAVNVSVGDVVKANTELLEIAHP